MLQWAITNSFKQMKKRKDSAKKEDVNKNRMEILVKYNN